MATKVGRRVTVLHLLHEGEFPGTIIDENHTGLCSVKLDCQDAPLTSVIYFDERPTEVRSTLWQICFPEERHNDR